MNKQKINNLLKDPNTNWKYVAIVAVLALLIVSGVLICVLLEKEIKIPEIKLPKKISETANWKIFRSEEYGFEIKYPLSTPYLGFSIDDRTGPGKTGTGSGWRPYDQLGLSEKLSQGVIAVKYFEVADDGMPGGSKMIISIFGNPASMNIRTWLEQNLPNTLKEQDGKETQIGPYSALVLGKYPYSVYGRALLELSESGGSAALLPRIFLISQDRQRIASFWWPSYNEVFDQILSTFKFSEIRISKEVEEPYIKVISPNSGEKWVIGQTYKIKWEFGGPASTTVRIRLIHEDGPIAPIVLNVPASAEEYPWRVPDVLYETAVMPGGVKPGDQYKIAIGEYVPRDSQLGDESDDYFSIIAIDL